MRDNDRSHTEPSDLGILSVMQRLMTIDEVSELLAIPVATLRRWRFQRSGPPAIKVGGHLRWDRDDLERWVVAQRDMPG